VQEAASGIGVQADQQIGLGELRFSLTGSYHGPRASFRSLPDEALAVFQQEFPHHLLRGERRIVFEQAVVLRAIRLLDLPVYLAVGHDPAEYAQRLLSLRRHRVSDKGFHREIRSISPLQDLTPCLVYADWLEEQDEPYLADRFRSVLIESVCMPPSPEPCHVMERLRALSHEFCAR
jgi:uncharacterized protein (TIGR02996 family)